METEDRLTRLETAFETVLPHLATKADIAMLETNIAKLESKKAWETVAISGHSGGFGGDSRQTVCIAAAVAGVLRVSDGTTMDPARSSPAPA